MKQSFIYTQKTAAVTGRTAVMNEIHRKILSILDRDVICELKNAENHIPESLLFHNHDGCEIYLFLNGDVNYYTESSSKKLERGI